MSELPVVAAERRAVAARARLTDALGELRLRLMPTTIARNVAGNLVDTGQDVAQAGVRAAKARPAVAAGLAAVAALLLIRRPITRALTGGDDETPPKPTRSADDVEPKDKP